jgi:hypothetical protein
MRSLISLSSYWELIEPAPIPFISILSGRRISSGDNQLKLSLALSRVNTNCPGLSPDEVDAFFVPGVFCRKSLKSSATSFRVLISLELFTSSFTHTGAPVGGPFSTAATSTRSPFDDSGINPSSTSLSISKTLNIHSDCLSFASMSSIYTSILFHESET